MSYILGALRKAEHDRQASLAPVTHPVFQNLNTDRPCGHSRRWRAFLYGGVLSVLALLLARYVIWPFDHQAIIPVTIEPQTSLSESILQPSVVDQHPAEKQIRKVEQKSAAPQMKLSDTETRKINTYVNGAKTIAPEKEWFSPDRVTGYIYFEGQPERSKLFIDGIAYRLQSRLPSGHELVVFEPSQVILLFQGQRQVLKTR